MRRDWTPAPHIHWPIYAPSSDRNLEGSVSRWVWSQRRTRQRIEMMQPVGGPDLSKTAEEEYCLRNVQT